MCVKVIRLEYEYDIDIRPGAESFGYESCMLTTTIIGYFFNSIHQIEAGISIHDKKN